MFYMMGMQNTPDRNSWRADQPSGEEYSVEMFYHDATGMLSVELLEDEIRITRCGSVPCHMVLFCAGRDSVCRLAFCGAL